MAPPERGAPIDIRTERIPEHGSGHPDEARIEDQLGVQDPDPGLAGLEQGEGGPEVTLLSTISGHGLGSPRKGPGSTGFARLTPLRKARTFG